jgi:hypothetical protein
VAIRDRREITFDAAAITDVLACSPGAAVSLGLPQGRPTRVRFDPQAGQVALLYGGDAGREIVVQSGPLGALLISYCLRARIRIPRDPRRDVRIGRDAVVLGFIQIFADTPSPGTPERPDASDPPRALSWRDMPDRAAASSVIARPGGSR